MDIRDILKDSKQFPDNHVLTIGTQQYTLGMLRTLSSEQQGELAKREAKAAEKEAALQKSFDELKSAQQATANLYAEAQKQLEIAKGTVATKVDEKDPFLALENDNILGPLVKYNKSLKSEIEAQKELIGKLSTGIQKMTESYLTDRLTDTYNSIVPDDKKSQFTLESLIAQGMQKGYRTPAGYVDLKRTWSDIAAPDQVASKVKEAEESGYKKAIEEMRSKGIMVATPSGNGGSGLPGVPFASQQEASEFKSLDDAFAAAAKDPQIWREFNGVTN